MSPVGTGEYYGRLTDSVNAHRGRHTSAEVLLYSIDFAVIEGCIRRDTWDRAAG